jgi:hypothetical protein
MFGGFGDRECVCHQACVDSMPAVKYSNYKKILTRRDRFFKTGFSIWFGCAGFGCTGVPELLLTTSKYIDL